MLSLSIPEELVVDILLRLPVKSLVRFKCIHRSWSNLLTDADFHSMHLQCSVSISRTHCYNLLCYQPLSFTKNMHIYLLPDDAREADMPEKFNLPISDEDDDRSIYACAGHCNGILCLYGFFKHIHDSDNDEGYDRNNLGDNIMLWNPATRVFKYLPAFERSRPILQYDLGFGFDGKNKDYKVVRIVNFSTGPTSVLEVYSLRTNSWRTSDAYVPAASAFINLSLQKFTCYVNGAYHWLVEDYDNMRILSLDLGDEVFGEMQVPLSVISGISAESADPLKRRRSFDVAVVDSCLALVVHFWSLPKYEIWVMEEYGVQESWVKKFTVEPSVCKLRRLRGNNDFIFKRDDDDDHDHDHHQHHDHHKSPSYDTIKTQLDNVFQYMDTLHILSYVESLVPL